MPLSPRVPDDPENAFLDLELVSNYSIIRVTLNAELATVDNWPWQAHMAFLKMVTLVFSVSMCLGLGLYAELFYLVFLEGCRDDEEKECFQLKNLKALCVRNAVSRKKAMSQIFSCVIYCKIKHSNCESNQVIKQLNHTQFPIK